MIDLVEHLPTLPIDAAFVTVGTREDRLFYFGQDADSIADRSVSTAEEAGWRGEIRIEGERMPSKREGDLLG